MIEELACRTRLRKPLDLLTLHSLGYKVLDFGSGDILSQAMWRMNSIGDQCVEMTKCSPVIPTAELRRIRNNVVARYDSLRSNYSNVGGSLDSTGIVGSYGQVFDAMEGGNYCYYQSDQRLVDDIQSCAVGANQILQAGFNQFAQNFSGRLAPMRLASQELRSAASAATISVEPVITAYRRLWSLNFSFHLHAGVNGALDAMMSEYEQVMEGSNTLFDQGTERVQNYFEADFRQSNTVFSGFAKARDHWQNKDGAVGYGMYVDNIRMYQEALDKLSSYTVLDTPRNKQIFAEIDLHIADVKKEFASFPTFVQAVASAGFALDPNTSALKFFARQLILNLAQGAGQHFTSVIAPGRSLIGTGFSYLHGGKMPPHSEHKDGKDCDIFSEYFKVGASTYDEQKAKDMAVFLLRSGVTRLIYTNTAVVNHANSTVPGNAVATAGSGHETHMHFDVETATAMPA